MAVLPALTLQRSVSVWFSSLNLLLCTVYLVSVQHKNAARPLWSAVRLSLTPTFRWANARGPIPESFSTKKFVHEFLSREALVRSVLVHPPEGGC